MAVIVARGFNPVTIEPLVTLEEYIPYNNNSLSSLGLFAEGGTLTQSYFINALTETPFNIQSVYLYIDAEGTWSKDIQVWGDSKRAFISPLGTPKLRFYLLSPSESNRIHTVELDSEGNKTLVSHITLDEYQNDATTAIEEYHTEGSGVTSMDNFIQSFDIICNIADYGLTGDVVTTEYLDLYYYDTDNPTLRQKYDILVYCELPFNNINVLDTETPIGVSSSDYVE